MAKQNKKKKSSKKLEDALEKFGFGSKIEHPNTALAENNIMMANAMAKSDNGLTQALDIFGGLAQQVGGQLLSKGAAGLDGTENGFTKLLANNGQTGLGILGALPQLFENGGTVDNRLVEVEGDEVAETPTGELIEFDGPTHEEGGIPTTLPVGTDVYSDRLKIKGKTMAQRKKDREKKSAKAEALYERTKDKAAKNALDRILAFNDSEEKKDMQIQQTIDAISKLPTEQKAYGGPVESLNIDTAGLILPQSQQLFENIETPEIDSPIELGEAIIKPRKKVVDNPIVNSVDSTSNESTDDESTNSESGFQIPNLFGSMTSGDVMGMLGNYMQVKGAKDYTLAERNANTPNQTFFDNYGDETLNKLADMKAGFQSALDQNNRDIDLNTSAAQSRNNNSARGINTLRAMNIATDNIAQQNKNKAYNAFMQMVGGVDGKIADTHLKIDEVQANDQKQKAQADQQDIAAFYQNMQTNAINEGKLLNSFGQAKNKYQMDATTQEVLKSIFPNFSFDPTTGKLSGITNGTTEDFTFKTPDYVSGNNGNNSIGVLPEVGNSAFGEYLQGIINQTSTTPKPKKTATKKKNNE